MKRKKEKYGGSGAHTFRYVLEYIGGILGTLAASTIIVLLCFLMLLVGRYL